MLKIFITGASSGIGESLARHYAGQGAQLALVARRGDWLDRVAASLTPKPECYVCDVRDAKALMSAAVDFMAKHGVPHIVIANAGVSRGTLTEIEDDLP
ncbi:MAG: SDR family NAD(P)-dependent oxidoreductase, partial [Burkholderiales bacterium]